MERIAYGENFEQLSAYLKSRRLLIPKKPRRFLDVQQEELEDRREQKILTQTGPPTATR